MQERIFSFSPWVFVSDCMEVFGKKRQPRLDTVLSKAVDQNTVRDRLQFANMELI